VSIFHKSNKLASSRRQIDLKDVKDGVLSLAQNRYRAVLEVSSVNFELKSEAEQDALIETYQSFLNSLPSAIQIIIRVREMDMDKYLETFRQRLSGEKKSVYRLQIRNYSEFVERLITANKILSRSFYVVLPYTSSGKTDFELVKEQLRLQSDIVSKHLGRLGMRARRLNSLEILDLFYSFYSPLQAKTQSITHQTMNLLKQAYL
jgi:hypothetical protein